MILRNITKDCVLSPPLFNPQNNFERLNSILLNAGFRYSYQNQTHKYAHVHLNLVLYWRDEYSLELGFEIYDVTPEIYDKYFFLMVIIRGALRNITVYDVINVFKKDGFYDQFTYKQSQKASCAYNLYMDAIT